jgi:hypothetical protein
MSKVSEWLEKLEMEKEVTVSKKVLNAEIIKKYGEKTFGFKNHQTPIAKVKAWATARLGEELYQIVVHVPKPHGEKKPVARTYYKKLESN